MCEDQHNFLSDYWTEGVPLHNTAILQVDVHWSLFTFSLTEFAVVFLASAVELGKVMCTTAQAKFLSLSWAELNFSVQRSQPV